MRLLVVGATGAVGQEILQVLEERNFPVDDLVPVASPRSAGRRLGFRGTTVEVRELRDEVFADTDMALFDVPDAVAARWAPRAAARGCIVVDNSAAWRMDPGVPLVVPEINADSLAAARKGIVASPNCTTLAMVLPVAPLHARAGVARLIVSSYQAVSGVGKAGVDELWDQAELVMKDQDRFRAGRAGEALGTSRTFLHPIAFNVIPHCGSVKDDGYTSEELKLCNETRKILSLPGLPVTATCVRVPVVRGHGVAVHARFEDALTPDDARETLRSASGVHLLDDPFAGAYPTPLEAAGRDGCYVGRIRQDLFDAQALELFCVTDNLRKGAALNTVQIAELLL